MGFIGYKLSDFKGLLFSIFRLLGGFGFQGFRMEVV